MGHLASLALLWRSVGGLSLVDRRPAHFQRSRALISLPLLTLGVNMKDALVFVQDLRLLALPDTLTSSGAMLDRVSYTFQSLACSRPPACL